MFNVSKYKEEIERCKNIIDFTREALPNELVYKTCSKFLYKKIDEVMPYITFVTNNELEYEDRRTGDYLHILYNPNIGNFYDLITVNIEAISNEGKDAVSIEIQFSSDKIRFVYKHAEKKVEGKNRDVVAIKNTTLVNSYINQDLRYDYKYIVESFFKLEQQHSNAKLEEIFINADHEAVKRIATIRQDDLVDDPASIKYLESEKYKGAGFKSSYLSADSEGRFHETTKEKFDEFIIGNNNDVKLKRY